jgi:hypothetical protein
MNSPLRTKTLVSLAPLYAAVAMTMVLADFGFSGLNLEGGLKASVTWIVPTALVVLLVFGILAYFGGED